MIHQNYVLLVIAYYNNLQRKLFLVVDLMIFQYAREPFSRSSVFFHGAKIPENSRQFAFGHKNGHY